MPDKVIEATAERVPRPKRPEMWIAVKWIHQYPPSAFVQTCRENITDRFYDDIIHIPAEADDE